MQPATGTGGTRPASRNAARDSRHSWESEPAREVHAAIEPRHLVRVAIELERRLATEEVGRSDPALALLAPAGMIDFRVHVREKAVLVWRGQRPGRLRHPLDETDADDGLDALESVLPGHDEAERRPILVRQQLAVEADGEYRERMNRLVDAQAFDVGPVQNRVALSRHLL